MPSLGVHCRAAACIPFRRRAPFNLPLAEPAMRTGRQALAVDVAATDAPPGSRPAGTSLRPRPRPEKASIMATKTRTTKQAARTTRKTKAATRPAPRPTTKTARASVSPARAKLEGMLAPCLWFDGQAEEAARFYVSLFPDSKVVTVARAAADNPSTRKGDVLAVDFTLSGQPFKGLNGGPYFKFNEAVSFVIPCDDQAEVDRYWKALSAVPTSEQCGWVKDKFGLSWQIVPKVLYHMLSDADSASAGRVMEAMLRMKKLDIAALERAARKA